MGSPSCGRNIGPSDGAIRPGNNLTEDPMIWGDTIRANINFELVSIRAQTALGTS